MAVLLCQQWKKLQFLHTRIELKAKSNKCYAASDRVNLRITLGDMCSSSPVSRLLSVSPQAETVTICHSGSKIGRHCWLQTNGEMIKGKRLEKSTLFHC